MNHHHDHDHHDRLDDDHDDVDGAPTWWPEDAGRSAVTSGGDGPTGRPAPAGPPLEASAATAGTAPPSTSLARWIAAALAGVAVAVLSVLGVNAVASAATSAGASATVLGPFGGRTGRTPPFSGSGGRSSAVPPVRAGPTAGSPRPPGAPGATDAQATGTIASITADRIEVVDGAVRTVIELGPVATIHDGSATIPTGALRVGQAIRVTGTRDGNVLQAATVVVIH